MQTLRKAALLIAVILMAAGTCHADYLFDDMQGPSGASTQWVIINDTNDTFGASWSETVRISADLLTSGTARLDVLSGNSENTVQDRNLQTLFLVLCEGSGRFDMSMKSQALAFDTSTPNLGVNTIVNENMTPYIDTKEADQSGNSVSEWKTFHFSVARQNDRNKYDTVIQSFMFQQNPGTAPSQSITRPMVISNVYSGTAADGLAPLVVRTALRDSMGAYGNIVAYDRSSWVMTGDKVTGGNQWVMVPVDDLNTDNARIEYYLTTEITNNSSYRYAARYYDSTGGTVPPSSWKFDIFRPQGTTNIPRSFLLAAGSNIAPGLVTVYSRRYNLNEQNKTPIHVFPVDAPDYGDYALTLSHRIIWGKRLGEIYKYPAQEGRFNLFEVTAFQPRLASTTFYDDVARVTGSEGTVSVPENQVFSSSSIKREVIADDVVQYFTADQSIPASVRGSGNEGILPLHITFNIPVTMIGDSAWWDEMLREWRSTGRIEDVFSNKYDIYLRAGGSNVWNMTQELKDKGYYNELVKVFLDEDRGRLTQDNYSGLLTVSFIVMLMDGTRDGSRPELSIVADSSISQQNSYIVIRDGIQDDRWNMTFFIAPSGWQDNPSHESGSNGTTSTNGLASGSSGGCGMFGALTGLLALVFMLRGRKGALILTLWLLMLTSASWGASSSSVTLIVSGTSLVANPAVTTPYTPPEYDEEGKLSVAETRGLVTFPAVSGANYTFETATYALDFARNPALYIQGNYDFDAWSDPYGYGIDCYDVDYDASLKATMTEITISIETGDMPDTVDTTGYSSINAITFTANPRTVTAPYGERHFIVGGTSSVTFASITFYGQNTGGGVTVSGGNVSFTGCSFNGCDVSGSGGGLNVTGGTVLVSGGGVFSGNSASDNGGAVSVSGGNVTVSEASFSDNRGYSGGAISLTNGTLALTDASIAGNSAVNGGAVYTTSGLTVGSGVTFNDASAYSPNVAELGGAMYVNGGTVTISGSGVLFMQNSASSGGGIYVLSGTVNVSGAGTEFSGNTSTEGGGAVWVGTGGRLLAGGEGLVFSGNSAVSGDGGGIYAVGTVTLDGTGTAFRSNTASGGRGGAVYMAGGSSVSLSGGADFEGNVAIYGGAVYMASARNATSLTLQGVSGVSFARNEAEVSGGAIYAEGNCGIFTEAELVFTGNTAVDGNGGALWLTDEGQLPEGTLLFYSNHANKNTTASMSEGNGGGIYVLGSDTSSAVIGLTRLYTFEGNSAMTYGGAIFMQSGDVTFDGYTGERSISVANSARIGGGFAASTAGTIRFNDCTVTNQSVTNGSGGVIWSKNVVITSCDFGAEGSPNMSQGTGNNNGGGAIYSNGSISLSNTTFSWNSAVQGGGAIYADTAEVTVRGSYFHDNNAQGGNGGALTLRNYCTTSIASTTFTRNESENLDGGAVYAQGRIEISYCDFSLNQARRSGGAIYFDQSNAQEPFSSFAIRNSMLTENSTQGGTEGGNGGGIFVAANRATVTSCTFSKNHLDLSGNPGEGGGLYLNTANYQTATNRIENCTFYENTINDGAAPNSDNTVYSGGGGIAVHCEGRSDVVSCTFAGNGSRYKGGAIYLGLEDGTLSVSGTMLVGNTNLGIYDIWSDGNISSGGYNRVGVYGTGSGVTDFYSETRNETDRTSYPSKGWSKSTFFGGNVLAENSREDIGDEVPPYVGSSRAGQERLLTLMLSEDASLPLNDRATNIIPYSRRTSFPDTDERGVSRTAGGEDIALDVGACFFDGTRYSEKKEVIAAYTISRVEISGIPNNLRRVGQTASLIAKVYYTNGRTALGGNGTGEEPVEWTSDKPAIIRVDKDTGDIVVLNITPGNTYVTITATTVRADLNGRRISDSKVIRVTEYAYSYLNTSPELMNYLQGYTEELTEYDIMIGLADRDSSSVETSSFQSSFAGIWGITASQVTELTTDNLSFNTARSYTASDGYMLPSGKAGVNVALSGAGAGSLLPLTYTWTFSGAEIAEILGHDLSGTEINATVADEIFTSMRIDFEGSGASRPVIGSGAVSASEAVRAGVLELTKSDGGKGLNVELTAYVANVSASSLNDGSQIVNGILVVPDGNGNDGVISGTMWMAGKAGSSSSRETSGNAPSAGNNARSSGSGGGGCEVFGMILLVPLMVMCRKQ